MGLFGKLLSVPFKIINAPIRAAEDIMGGGERTDEDDRILSMPLKKLTDELDEI